MKMSWAVVAACGPTDQEIVRVGDLLESVFCHEPKTAWVAVIDSADDDRKLAQQFKVPAGTTIVGIRNPKSGWADGQWGPLCVGILAAYDWVARETDAEFVAKFDSDALVIAPFAEQIRHAMRVAPTAAVFGSYKIDCNGNRRDITGMAALMRRLHKFALLDYQPKRFGRRFPLAIVGRPAGMRRHIGAALRNGYEFGEHVSGGAYAATRELLDRMLQRRFLAERHVWANSQVSEDVMISMYARACGLSIAGYAADGEAFGVKHVGLPDTPDQLLRRGYSIIHSVKSDPHFTEEQIRAFYRQERLTPGGARLPSPAPHAEPAPRPAALLVAANKADTSPVHDADLEDLDDAAFGFYTGSV
jgi:hypothetical protein